VRAVAVAVALAVLAGAAGWTALELDRRDPPAAVPAQARVVTPLLSVRRAPDALAAPRRAEQVAAAVAPIVARLPAPGCVVVTDGDRTVFAHEPTLPLAPASTQKLLTASGLLDAVGPTGTLRTVLAVDVAPVDGRIDGDLWLIGEGDPLLTTEAYRATFADPDQPATRFEDIADTVVALGVREIGGSVIGDGTRYDDQRVVPSWPDRYIEQVSAGPLTGLGVNDGFSSFAETERLVEPGVPAEDPPAFTAGVLTELLRERGVVVVGEPRSAPAPEQVLELAAVPSLPAGEIARQMLQFSDNTTAELVLKELGAQRSGPGSTASGVLALVELLAREGVPLDGVAPVDGSGLDLGNRVTCPALVTVLDGSGPDSPLAEGLAVSGRSGTLRERMVGTPAEGRIVAKTGSLRHVSALAGFALAPTGRTWTFAYVVNGPEEQFLPALATELQDELAVALVTVPEVDLDALGPVPIGG